MKKRFFASILAVLVLGAALAGCGGGSSSAAGSAAGSTAGSAAGGGASGDPVKIGLTVPLSGDRASEGSFAQNAAAIVEEEINAAGGVLGRPLEIAIEDSLGTDVGATNAFLKLASDAAVVAVIGPDNSNDNIAIAGSAESNQIVATGQGSSPTLQATCEEGQWNFQLRACDSTLCAALMNYAINETGAKSFTVIHDTDTASANQAALFSAAIEELGGTIDGDISFTTGTKDFTAQLTQAQANGSDALVMACSYTEAAILIEQTRSMGIESPVFGSNAFGDPMTIGLAGDSLNGCYSVTSWVPNTPNPLGAAFSEKYSEIYGEDCAKAAAQIRDHVYVLCAAIEAAGSTDRAAVRDAMLTLEDYQGAITVYNCSLRGNCGQGGLIVQIQDGTPTILKEITG